MKIIWMSRMRAIWMMIISTGIWKNGILREAELDMENIHQPERQDPEPVGGGRAGTPAGERAGGAQPVESAAAPVEIRARVQGGRQPMRRRRDKGFRKDGILDGNHPEKAALKAEHRKTVKGGVDRCLYGGHSARGSRRASMWECPRNIRPVSFEYADQRC